MMNKPSVLITGASTGIGAVYAGRFAKRGHDLVMVARHRGRMEVLANRLRGDSGVAIDILQADLSDPQALRVVEMRLRDDDRIGILVNNAGAVLPGTFAEQMSDDIASIINLNALAVARLAAAVAPRFVGAGSGAIVNIGPVVGVVPEFQLTVYGATKAFVLFLSQGLQAELGPKGVYVQAVLPAATRTEIWDKSGIDVNTVAGVMEVEELVDAAMVGFDRREPVTIPPLANAELWTAYEAARRSMIPNFSQPHAAERCRGAA